MGWFFGELLAPLDRVVRRAQLARLMRFYVDRAGRHRLSPKAYARLSGEIDQMVLKEGYMPGTVADPDVGYVFCPEHRTGQVERIYSEHSDTSLWLFGPTMLPDETGHSAGSMMLPLVPEADDPAAAGYDEVPAGSASPMTAWTTDAVVTTELPNSIAQNAASHDLPIAPEVSDASTLPNAETRVVPVVGSRSDLEGTTRPMIGSSERPPVSSSGASSPVGDPVEIFLGETLTHVPVDWHVSIRTNPHLMMVGLPGMGKTTALINIATQLEAVGIAPVIFSYHDDIDEKLTNVLGPLRTIDFDGLGFNPLRVDAPGPTAYIDVAGTLRDIFASIFPDLGEIQLEELRGAIKQSYDDLGWNDRGRDRPDPPRFRTFVEILKSRPKPNQNLLARLQELTDYGFFDGEDGAASILMDHSPTLVRVHLSTNEIVQRAFSAFVLYSIYKDMFRRGVQDSLTHAIIFDEAHRAAKLKLIPRFAKECRKFGLALALASQGVRDFDGAMFEAVASYLVLRVTEADARTLARNTGATAEQQRTTDRLKALEPYHAMFFTASSAKPRILRLTPS